MLLKLNTRNKMWITVAC